MYPALIPVFKQLIAVLGSISLVLSGMGSPKSLILGSFNPTGGGTYRLQSSIGTSDSSITLSSFKEPVSNIKYTMSYLNSSQEFGTLEPGNNSKKEFVSFTGITQNADGTATLTGVSRGLSFSYPYTASTTLQQTHSGQSIFILSNPPQLTNQYANKNNSETINGIWTFGSTTPPQYDANVTASGNQFVSFAQLNATAIQGAGTSTESALGLIQLVSGSQVGTGQASSTSGAPLGLINKYASSTYNGSSSKVLVTTGVTNQIDSNFIATSSSYTWTASTTFSGSPIGFTGSSITMKNATTTTLGVLGAVNLNGVPYSFPSTQGASSTVWSNNGSGIFTSNPQTLNLLGATTTGVAVSYATTTTFSSANKTLHMEFYSAGTSNTGAIFLQFNGDGGANNYGEVIYQNGALFAQDASQPVLYINANGTTTPTLFEIDVTNISGTRKVVTWTGTTVQTGAQPPVVLSGAGVWNNTSSNISSVSFGITAGYTFTAGSFLKVYARQDN